MESWDNFSPWISLKATCVCAKNHLSYFDISFRVKMPPWIARGVRLCCPRPSRVEREARRKASWPSAQAESQEKERERCIYLRTYWCSGDRRCWKLDVTHYKQTHQTKPFSQPPQNWGGEAGWRERRNGGGRGKGRESAKEGRRGRENHRNFGGKGGASGITARSKRWPRRF